MWRCRHFKMATFTKYMLFQNTSWDICILMLQKATEVFLMWLIKFIDGSILNISSLEHRLFFQHSASFCGQCLPSTADKWIWGHVMNPHIFFNENWDPKLSFKVFHIHIVKAHHFLYWFVSQKLFWDKRIFCYKTLQTVFNLDYLHT